MTGCSLTTGVVKIRLDYTCSQQAVASSAAAARAGAKEPASRGWVVPNVPGDSGRCWQRLLVVIPELAAPDKQHVRLTMQWVRGLCVRSTVGLPALMQPARCAPWVRASVAFSQWLDSRRTSRHRSCGSNASPHHVPHALAGHQRSRRASAHRPRPGWQGACCWPLAAIRQLQVF